MHRSNLNLALLIFLASSPIVETNHTLAQERADSTLSLVAVKYNVHGSGLNQYLRDGEHLHITVKAIAGIDVFVYVIYHDAAGDSFLVFPNAKENRNLLRGGRSREIPGPNSDFNLTIRAPFGKERLRVIASPQRLPEVEQAFRDGRSVDELNELLQSLAANPDVDTQFSEFETLPNGEDLQSSPEMVQ